MLNGKKIPDKPLVNGSEDDLVLVRSIVTKRKGDLSTITPDLIGTKFSFTDGAAIGLCLHFMKWNIAADAGSGMKFVIVGDKNGFRVIQGFYQLHAVL